MTTSLVLKRVTPLLLAVSLLSAPGAAAEDKPGKVPPPAAVPKLLLEFAGAAGEPEWAAVNDGVMGGLSQGGATIKDGRLLFSGTLSLENNGGFSSVRTRDSRHDLGTAQAVVLRVKGDGRVYQLRLSTDARFRGSRISYGAEFPTRAGEWTEVKVPFAKFSPSHHGTKLDGPALDLSKVEEIGLLIGDKRPGAFALAVDWIKVE
jgi:monofunctional biosynthetic peptidoglycan transglycosylase